MIWAAASGAAVAVLDALWRFGWALHDRPRPLRFTPKIERHHHAR